MPLPGPRALHKGWQGGRLSQVGSGALQGAAGEQAHQLELQFGRPLVLVGADRPFVHRNFARGVTHIV